MTTAATGLVDESTVRNTTAATRALGNTAQQTEDDEQTGTLGDGDGDGNVHGLAKCPLEDFSEPGSTGRPDCVDVEVLAVVVAGVVVATAPAGGHDVQLR